MERQEAVVPLQRTSGEVIQTLHRYDPEDDSYEILFDPPEHGSYYGRPPTAFLELSPTLLTIRDFLDFKYDYPSGRIIGVRFRPWREAWDKLDVTQELARLFSL